jgi:phytoene dehydrogenase-like protein
MLFDGEFFRLVDKAGWYDEFKTRAMDFMLDVLEESIYPELNRKILFKKSGTPVSLMNRFNIENGAITGWSMEQKPPVPNHLAKIITTAETPIPDVYKSGQWSYSPSGVPIAILTGRIAASVILRDARKLQKQFQQQKQNNGQVNYR